MLWRKEWRTPKICGSVRPSTAVIYMIRTGAIGKERFLKVHFLRISPMTGSVPYAVRAKRCFAPLAARGLWQKTAEGGEDWSTGVLELWSNGKKPFFIALIQGRRQFKCSKFFFFNQHSDTPLLQYSGQLYRVFCVGVTPITPSKKVDGGENHV